MRMYGEEVPCGVQNVLTVQVMRWEVERGNESEQSSVVCPYSDLILRRWDSLPD